MRLSKDDQSYYYQKRKPYSLILTSRNTFRKQLRDCRLEKAETFKQFSGRLASYLDKWLGLAKVEHTYKAVCEFLAWDQFLYYCSQKLC